MEGGPSERELARLRRERSSRGRTAKRLEEDLNAKARSLPLFGSHPELGPHLHVSVQDYGARVSVTCQILPEGVRLLPLLGIRPGLEGFFASLNAEMESTFGRYHLPPCPDVSSGPVFDGAESQYIVGWTWHRSVPGRRRT
jgi:hypothetical protein